MSFFSSLVRSVYSAALYRDAYRAAHGFGLRYSTQLLVLQTVLVFVIRMATLPAGAITHFASPENAQVLVVAAMVFGLALLSRLCMLFSLAVAAQLIALIWKLPMGYAAAFRLTALAYTPVALMDTAAFAAGVTSLSPWPLFVGGLLMVAASVYANRSL